MANPNDPRALANQALAPVLAEIQRQKAEEARRAQNEQATAQASGYALSQVLDNIPGRIQDTYKQAGDSTSAYAKGFSAAFQQGSEQTANELNRFLQQQGSPQQVTAAGTKGADVVYGLGYIPAAGLAREGAAFSAAAEGFPAAALLRGQENANLAGRQSQDRLAQLDALLRQEKAKVPGLVQEIRAQQQEQATKDRAQRLNEALAVENLGIRKEQLGVSKFNAQTSRLNAKLRAQQQRFSQALSRAKLDLDQEQFDLALKREERLSKPKAKGGFTAKQRQDLSQTAVDTARDDFLGYEDEDGNKFDPRPPVETLRDLIASGVPFSIAIKAIQRFARGKKPAELKGVTFTDEKGVERPLWDAWRATLKWTKK